MTPEEAAADLAGSRRLYLADSGHFSISSLTISSRNQQQPTAFNYILTPRTSLFNYDASVPVDIAAGPGSDGPASAPQCLQLRLVSEPQLSPRTQHLDTSDSQQSSPSPDYSYKPHRDTPRAGVFQPWSGYDSSREGSEEASEASSLTSGSAAISREARGPVPFDTSALFLEIRDPSSPAGEAEHTEDAAAIDLRFRLRRSASLRSSPSPRPADATRQSTESTLTPAIFFFGVFDSIPQVEETLAHPSHAISSRALQQVPLSHKDVWEYHTTLPTCAYSVAEGGRKRILAFAGRNALSSSSGSSNSDGSGGSAGSGGGGSLRLLSLYQLWVSRVQPTTPSQTPASPDFPSSPGLRTVDVEELAQKRFERTELTLDDIAEDSPLVRAAFTNLDKRTVQLKRLCKTVLKASADVSMQFAALQASESALEETMVHMASVLPVFGTLARDSHIGERIRSSQYREEQMQCLRDYVDEPIKQTLAICRAAQEAQRRFETESKTFYAATQKWLSKANGHGINPNRVPPEQRNRELRFLYARLEVFDLFLALHGGETEVELAVCALQATSKLQASREKIWQYHSRPHRNAAPIVEHLRRVREAVTRQRTACKAKLVQVAAEMAAQTLPEHEGSAESPWSASTSTPQLVSPNTSPSKLSSLPEAQGGKQRLRNMLNSLVDAGSTDSMLSSSASTPALALRGLRQQVTARLQGGVRFRSDAEMGHYPQHNVNVSTTSDNWDLETVLTPPRTKRRPMSSGPGSPVTAPPEADRQGVPQRSISMSGGRSPTGPAFRTRTISMATQAEAPDSRPAAMAPPRRPSLGDRSESALRKKEGILWVMNKPIPASAGTAPRNASRSNLWHEAWVVLSGSGHLSEHTEWRENHGGKSGSSSPIIDLRFATVREARGVDRRFAFEVVTRERRHLFQASSEEAMKEWMSAIAKAIESLINGTSSIRQVEKVAQRAAAASLANVDAGEAATDDWGAGSRFSAARASGTFSPPLNENRWSQSLTDLTSASGISAARLFRKRDGEKSSESSSSYIRGHGAAASENNTAWSKRVSLNGATPAGISNKTPVSGYIGSRSPPSSSIEQRQRVTSTREQSEGGRSSFTSSSSNDGDHDLDKRIEAMVNSHYGGAGNYIDMISSSPGPHRSSLSPPSPSQRQGPEAEREPSSSEQASTRQSRAAEIVRLSRLPQNSRCADCRAPDPRWASWSLSNSPCCIFICITCSGIHRGLGVHVSKVKSVELDDWTEEQLEAARKWGNDRANRVWEAKKPPEAAASHEDRKRSFWAKKYVERAWKDEGQSHDAGGSSRVAGTTRTSPDDGVKGGLDTARGTPHVAGPRAFRAPVARPTAATTTTTMMAAPYAASLRAQQGPVAAGRKAHS